VAAFELMRENVGQLVYLDVRIDESGVSADPDYEESTVYLFIPGSYDDLEGWCGDEPAYCGAEYLIRDVGEATDSGFYWIRGQWRLLGYFAVSSIEGPFQGSYSVVLRAVAIDDATRGS
jgi:hypothetical protein